MLTKFSRMQIKRVGNFELRPLFVWNDLGKALFDDVRFGHLGNLMTY